MASGMKNYDISLDGGESVYTTVTAPTTTVNITGRTPETMYPVCVRARDNAGNVSAWSEILEVTTAESSGDVTAPTVPTNLDVDDITQTTATASWTASTDGTGVTKYQVKVDDETLGDESSSTSRALTDLEPGVEHTVAVRAGDAAGNWSDWTDDLVFETLSSGGGGGATPLAAYALDEGTGTTASDSVGSRHITGLGTGSGLWVLGGGLANGGGTPPTVPSPEGLETASRTLMFWAQRKTSDEGWWVQFHISSADTAAWGIGRIAGGLYCRARVGGSNVNLTSSTLPADEWHHLAITYDGSAFRAYMDGVQFGSQSASGTLSDADTIRLFDAQSANAVYIKGLRFYDEALDASAIQAAMAETD